MKNPTQESTETAWHNLAGDEVVQRLHSDGSGITPEEAAQRLQEHGYNRLRPPARQSALRRFLLQFHNVLIYVLLLAALITAFLQHWTDSSVILLVVVLNALIGYVQEGKAEKALEAIRGILALQATVRRGGKQLAVPAEELVPGDIVLLQSGDRVPADLRLLKCRELRIDEAMLTGESQPSSKDPSPVETTAVIGDRHSIAFSGTLVSYGQGQGVVVATGDDTEIGRISGMLGGIETLTTPLLRQMDAFGKRLSLGIAALAVITFNYGITLRDYGANEMFLAAVGLAVAAIPEGLPAIMTITLAIGVQRMAKRNAIIRRLPAVETLGSVNIICSDKTGTLTRNEMTVQSLILDCGQFEVSGIGYDPHGDFSLDGESLALEDYPLIGELARAALLCNDATLQKKEGHWQLQGDPTEGALVTLAMKAGLDPERQNNDWPRTDVIPFESKHRFMATLHHDHANHAFIYLKGAPEEVLGMCNRQRAGGEDVPLKTGYWEEQMVQLAARGQRLLAIAQKPVEAAMQNLRFDDVDGGLSLLGIVGIIDPPRSEAVDAVAACRSAGIEVKMITGDHEATARAIGKQLGIGDGEHALSGTQIDALDADGLRQAIHEQAIFARTSPEHKLRLVEALQAEGQVVAMTGDGVNDAPALKRADVGVAMGQKGTEVAKEAAEMVLTDDNFASIAHAVEEGRTVYDNLKKAILFILPTNGGEALTIITAIVFGAMMPITPVQILWVNMITAVTLALALAFEPPEDEVMKRPPRPSKEPLLSEFLLWRITFVSLILVTGTFGIFAWERLHGMPIELARTTAVNTLVMFEIFYIFSSRYLIANSLTLEGLTGNRYVLIAVAILLLMQLAFTYAPPMQYLFDTRELSLQSWLRIVIITSSVLWLVELEKWWFRRRQARMASDHE